MHLAHCSDLHLLSLEGARFLDFANKRWIGGLNLLWNRSRHHQAGIWQEMIADFNRGVADHVLVTGDITNVALEGEFRYARALFDELELGPEEVTVIPGNHDAYVARGAVHFAEHFGPFFAADDGWQWDDDDPWPVVRVRGPVAIIALSTSQQTPWFTCYGRLGVKQLGRLREVLEDPRLAGRLRLLAIHHPPAGPWAESRVRGLHDRRRLWEILGDTGAELVLHGHEHRDLTSEIAGPAGAVPVRGIQSGTYDAGDQLADRRARYRIYEVLPGSEGQRASVAGEMLRVWDPERGAFSEDDPLLVPSPAAATGT